MKLGTTFLSRNFVFRSHLRDTSFSNILLQQLYFKHVCILNICCSIFFLEKPQNVLITTESAFIQINAFMNVRRYMFIFNSISFAKMQSKFHLKLTKRKWREKT